LPDASVSYPHVSPWIPANYSIVAASSKPGARPVTAGTKKRNTSAIRDKSNPMSTNISRHIPKNIAHDKEELYDETIRLKKDMNVCRGENTKLKTQIQQYENDITKKDNYIRELLNQINAQQGSTDSIKKVQKIKVDTHLVAGLKKKIKELNGANKSKNDEVENLKRSIKATKINEIETEAQVYIEESKRLRQMLEDLMNKGSGVSEIPPTAEVNPGHQSTVIKKIKKDNEDLVKALKEKEDDLTSWKEKAKKLDKQLQTQEKEMAKDKKMIKDSQSEMSKIKAELENRKSEVVEENEKIKRQVDELQKANKELNKVLKQKDKSFETLEEKYNEVVKHQSAKKAHETELGLLRGRLKDCI